MRYYNYAFDIAFEVVSSSLPEKVTGHELLFALKKRVADLEMDYFNGGEEILEACGMPFDMYEEEEL